MKKLLIGCLVFIILLILAGFAAWKYAEPRIEGWMKEAVSNVQEQAFEKMGLPGLGTSTGTAYLTEIKGEVFVTHEGKREEAQEGPVGDGDMIETLADGSAAIVWPDYGRTLIDVNSKLTINKAAHDGDKLNVKINVDGGRIWTRLERLLGRDSGFDVRASNVVATVRGTSFGVDRRKPGAIGILVAESKVNVTRMTSDTSDEPSAPSILMEPNQLMDVATDIKISMPKPKIVDASMMQNDPFILEGNTKIDPALMSWISKAMELYRSIPQDREMTEAEAAILEQKAMELWSILPEEYKDGQTYDDARTDALDTGTVNIDTSATLLFP